MSPPGLQKLAEADRTLFTLVMDSCRSSLKPKPSGVLPMDEAIKKFVHDPRVSFHLFPTPKRQREETASSSGQHPAKRFASAGASKGKGKFKSGSTGVPRMPPGLLGHRFQDLHGKPLCFAFNLDGCTVSGERCPKGEHSCAGCGMAGHALKDCPKKQKSGKTSANNAAPKSG
eukprot:4080295-Amphidinium_carterae.1